jgi:hypothetical protein
MGSIAVVAVVEGSGEGAFEAFVEGSGDAALDGAVDAVITSRINGKRLHEK